MYFRCDSVATRTYSYSVLHRLFVKIAFVKIMRSPLKMLLHCLSPALLACLLATAWAGVGGSISGAIKDQSGAAIAQASVTLIDTSTGVRRTATADDRGTYTFPVLPVGNYVLEANHPGFQPYRRTGIALDTNDALLLDIVLQVGER